MHFRKFILEYFESHGNSSAANPKCCDNCIRGSSSQQLSKVYSSVDDEGNFDFTENASLFLQAMELASRSRLAIAVLRGSRSKDTASFDKSEIFGKGKLYPKEYWDLLIQQLQRNGFLQMKRLPPPYKSTIETTPLSHSWMRKAPAERLILRVIPEMYRYLPKKRRHYPEMKVDVVTAGVVTAIKTVKTADNSKDKQLEIILNAIRSALAESSDCQPFFVASNAAIQQMIDKKPRNIDAFKSSIFDGFSVAKTMKFAQAFVDGIAMFLVSFA